MVEGAPHMAKRSMINLCVYGVPLPPYIKEWRRGRAGPQLWRALGSPTPTGSRIPPFPSWSRREGRESEKRRKEGAPPLPLVQFGLGLGGRAACLSLSPLKPNKAHILLGEFP